MFGGTKYPHSPLSRTSLQAPTFDATIGIPSAIASAIAMPNPSSRLAENTNKSTFLSISTIFLLLPRNITLFFNDNFSTSDSIKVYFL